MLTSDRRTADLTTAGRLRTPHAVVGIDGGGSKTEAVIMDAHQQVIGEGLAGASNPLRVGIANAAAAIREAIDKACVMAKVRRTDLIAAEIGLAGARRQELRARMRETICSSLGIHDIEVVTDADIALYASDGWRTRPRCNRRQPVQFAAVSTPGARGFAQVVGGQSPEMKAEGRGLPVALCVRSPMLLTVAVPKLH